MKFIKMLNIYLFLIPRKIITISVLSKRLRTSPSQIQGRAVIEIVNSLQNRKVFYQQQRRMRVIFYPAWWDFRGNTVN